MRYFFMMRSHPIHDGGALIETLKEIGTHLGVGALDLVGHGLTDIVEQAGSLG
jgi:hypothetical protein